MAITSGHEVICCDRNRRGGLKRIFLVEQGKIGTVAASSGVVSAFPTVNSSGAASAEAFEFQFDRGTAGFSANASRENGSTIITVELEFYIPKVTAEVNNRLNELATSCGVYAIVETYADDCNAGGSGAETYHFVLGYDTIFETTAYMEFASGEQSTGVGLQDANGTTVTLSGEQGEYPLEYSGTITPGATIIDPVQLG
tara:strand:- start:5979 stop:6575 length:597 start_codon:yes stop_codon:yes gene_type:complete